MQSVTFSDYTYSCVVRSLFELIPSRFWDLQNGSELRKIRKMDNEIESEDQLLCCRFSPDMSQLAVCSNNGNLYLIGMRGIVQEMVENFT
jgi:WD40 repeat protein